MEYNCVYKANLANIQLKREKHIIIKLTSVKLMNILLIQLMH